MLKPFSHRGVWFLPGDPNTQIHGTLVYSPEEGARLDLMGAFDEPTLRTDLEPIPVILGHILHGADVTLLGCTLQHQRYSFRSQVGQSTEYYVNYAFIGAHFNSPEQIKFGLINVEYAYLADWVSAQNFSLNYDFAARCVTVRYRLPEPRVLTDLGDRRLSLLFGHPPMPGGKTIKRLEIEDTVFLQITSDEEQPFTAGLQLIYRIQDFLTFAVARPSYPTVITGYTAAAKQLNSEKLRPIDIYYRASVTPKPLRAVRLAEMLFVLGDVQEDIPMILSNFITQTSASQAAHLKPTYELYFSTIYGEGTYPVPRFLSLAQAIEVFHRRTMEGKELPAREHKQRRDAILSAVPPDLRDWLEAKLAFSNEVSLNTRLTQLHARYRNLVSLFLPDAERFARQVTKTRNYYTHYNTDQQRHAATGLELVRLTAKIRLMLEICILSSLGISDEVITRTTRTRRERLGVHGDADPC